MAGATRFGVSMEKQLLERFDRYCRRRKFRNRSDALRELARQALVAQEWSGDEDIVGTITLVYDHHQSELADRLTGVQHDHFASILSTLHVHLDHDNCLEIIALRGKASLVQRIADALITSKGVKHGTLSATTSGRYLEGS